MSCSFVAAVTLTVVSDAVEIARIGSSTNAGPRGKAA
jgi:hypothetical protein